jgi:hypothetical protein
MWNFFFRNYHLLMSILISVLFKLIYCLRQRAQSTIKKKSIILKVFFSKLNFVLYVWQYVKKGKKKWAQHIIYWCSSCQVSFHRDNYLWQMINFTVKTFFFNSFACFLFFGFLLLLDWRHTYRKQKKVIDGRFVWKRCMVEKKCYSLVLVG